MRARSNLSVLSLAATMFAAYSIFCFHGTSVATIGSGRIAQALPALIGTIDCPSPVSEPILGNGSALEPGKTAAVESPPALLSCR